MGGSSQWRTRAIARIEEDLRLGFKIEDVAEVGAEAVEVATISTQRLDERCVLTPSSHLRAVYARFVEQIPSRLE